MKNKLILLIIIVGVLTSCATKSNSGHCDAYGKVNVNNKAV